MFWKRGQRGYSSKRKRNVAQLRKWKLCLGAWREPILVQEELDGRWKWEAIERDWRGKFYMIYFLFFFFFKNTGDNVGNGLEWLGRPEAE